MTNWVIPLVAALAAPIFGFLAITWRLSGRIQTSEASRLWEEARIIRNEYRERMIACETQLTQLRNEIQTITARNTLLSRQNHELRKELRRVKSES